MKFPRTYCLGEIAQLIHSEYVGAIEFPITGMNEIHVVEEGDIVFVDHPKYYDKALTSKASVVLINKKVECPEGKALLISDDPFRDFNKLTHHFKPFIRSNRSISDSAVIGEATIIQPNVFVGNNVTIGKNCTSGITIGKGAVVLAQTGVAKSLAGGKTYFGYPAEESREKLKQMAAIRQFPSIVEKLKKN